MNINDYLIPHAGKDWRSLLSGWFGLLPQNFTVWLVNRFGDLFVLLDDDSVCMLDVGVGTFKRLANNRSHFGSLIDAGSNASNWLMIPLVDACVAAGLTLGHNQCYGYDIPPILGGQYQPGNVSVTDLAVHYAFLADIYRQTRSLPEGTPISGTVFDRDRRRK
jgi:hypothetical protein